MLRLWRPVQAPVELVICVLALIVIAGPELTLSWRGELVMSMKVVLWLWAFFLVLEMYQEWKGGSKPMRSTIGEIYEGYRSGDPDFKRASSPGLLTSLTVVLSTIALLMS